MSQRPLVVGLLVCEQLIVEARTYNVTLVNCFTKRKAEQFPSGPHRFTVFALLADGLGEIALDVVVRRLEDLKVIYRQRQRLQFADPLEEVRFLLRITNCSFPTPGAYDVQLLADGDMVGQHRFMVA